MSDLKTFVKNIVIEIIKREFPSARTPACMTARILDRKEKNGIYEYVIRFTDGNGNADAAFPEIPEVKSEQLYEIGEEVTAVNIRGEIHPAIVGRWYG